MISKVPPFDVARRLCEIVNDNRYEQAVRIILGIVSQRVSAELITVQEALSITYKTLLDTNLHIEADFSFYIQLKDYYDLATLDGIKFKVSPEEMLKEFEELLGENSPHLDAFMALYQEEMGLPWEDSLCGRITTSPAE